MTADRSRGLEPTITSAQVIACTGAGGVGKTSTAAALALAAARGGRRTIVLTIDPARRLAQSLGLAALDNVPRPVAGVDNLDAMMLDMKRTFDEVIDRHAQSPQRAERIKRNHFYVQLSSSLAGTQEYMAMEKLYDLHQTGRYDCIVIDTPPTRNALDFLDAPRRLSDFLEGRFLRLFLAPGVAAGRLAGRAAGLGTGLFLKAFGRITGAGVLRDLAEFFQSLEGMYEGFKQRAQAVYGLLQSPGSAFVVIATPEMPALREARYFLQRLESEGMPTAGLVINRVTPPMRLLSTRNRGPLTEAAARLVDGTPEQRAASALLQLAVDQGEAAIRERRTIASTLHGVHPGTLVVVPQLATDINDLDGLARLAAYLRGPQADDPPPSPAVSSHAA